MSWWEFAAKNLRVAKAFAGRAMVSPTGGSYARWMAVGAGLGAVRGLADNVVGEDRVSVLGGMAQGAMTFGALRGMGSLWGMRNRLRSGMGAARRSARSGLGPIITPPPRVPLALPYYPSVAKAAGAARGR